MDRHQVDFFHKKCARTYQSVDPGCFVRAKEETSVFEVGPSSLTHTPYKTTTKKHRLKRLNTVKCTHVYGQYTGSDIKYI